MEINLLPLNKEQTFLGTFFLTLAQFDYDKAKELADKERESSKVPPGAWSSMLSCLAQVAVAEKSYTGLIFLAPKGFLRKDSSLKSCYEIISADLQKIRDAGKSGPGDSLEKLLAHLCGQLAHFLVARTELMDLYERCCNPTSGRHIVYDELSSQLEKTIVKHQKNFHHPILGPLASSFSFECEGLLKLLEAQLDMQQWKFLPSLLHLHEAHSKLGAWETLIQPRESRRGLSFGSRSHPVPALYQWLWKFKGALVSKFSLYFHEILSKQTTPQEMKSLCSKAPSDFHSRFVSFQRKADAKYIALILDASSCDQFKGHGYHHPDRYCEPPKGLDSYPAILCYPAKPTALWPNVIMIMADSANELNVLERVISLYDKTTQMTYFLTRVEPRLTLVIIFDTKRSEKDAYITNFMVNVSSELRYNKLFTSLKSGAK